MEDAEFCVLTMLLIVDTRRALTGLRKATSLLSQASSYASSGHMELSLAAIQALLQTVGRAIEKDS